MGDELLETLEALERRGWDSLCEGTGAELYGQLMTTDGLMVLANGVAMTRDEVVAALRDAPPWAGYELTDVRLVTTGRDSAALVYVGAAHRVEGDPVVCRMSSVYVTVDGSWRLALHTQTPSGG